MDIHAASLSLTPLQGFQELIGFHIDKNNWSSYKYVSDDRIRKVLMMNFEHGQLVILIPHK